MNVWKIQIYRAQSRQWIATRGNLYRFFYTWEDALRWANQEMHKRPYN